MQAVSVLWERREVVRSNLRARAFVREDRLLYGRGGADADAALIVGDHLSHHALRPHHKESRV